MAGYLESYRAADKLNIRARRLLGDSDYGTVEFGTTKIEFSRAGLNNGNITSIIGLTAAPGNLYKNSTWNLKNPPIDPPDVAEMYRLADILAIFL